MDQSLQFRITITNLTDRELDSVWTYDARRLVLDGEEQPSWFGTLQFYPFSGLMTLLPHGSISWTPTQFYPSDASPFH